MPIMRTLVPACLMLFLCLGPQAPEAAALTVVTHFIGGSAPGNAAGGGNLVDIFSAAARRWESAYGDDFTLHIYYGWAAVGDAGTHTLIEQGGEPHREIIGTILFDNSGAVSFFLDPTPDADEEYQRRTEEHQDLGAGFVNVARILGMPRGEALGRCDLLSVAMHEIGHALGLSARNARFGDEAGAGFLLVREGLPHAGTEIPLASNKSGVVPHIDAQRVAYGSLMAGVGCDERRYPSGLDILANAQISSFAYPNLSGQAESAPPPTHRLARGIPGNAVPAGGN